MFLTFASGVLAALAARTDLRVSPKPTLGSARAVRLPALCELGTRAHLVYFYVFHGMVSALRGRHCAGTERSGAAGLSARGGRRWRRLRVRSESGAIAARSVGGRIGGRHAVHAIGVLPLSRHRLAVVGSYAQFHGDFGHTPYGGALLQGTIGMTCWMLLGLAFIVYRLGSSAKRTG